MKRYIIEIDAEKIFSYEAEGCGQNFHCRLMKPHGDKFYTAGKFLDYWAWFAEETADGKPDICFIYVEDERQTLERLKKDAPKLKNSTWEMSELKKFFTEYRDATSKENFRWEDGKIIFDDGRIFNLDGVANFILSDKTEPAREQPKPKFRVKVYTPPVNQEEPPEEISNPEKDIPPLIDLPDEFKEKISVEDFQNYIEEQTGGQCDKVSFKK